ncbi:hypothetical protein LEP1GSC179_2508 [Leptospira santarosai str. MOR084]|uniref:Uncharacterized protein n=1 Tax=Leptospira santarosai str. MOR084 TaxID=1049984 RepID=A0A0E2BDV1_9LEPT|nr:hypothetical protein LEP1GSC179_2508 [Leptospira santarosai str. MOR084]
MNKLTVFADNAIGLERVKFQIGLLNLVFDFRRFALYQS